VVGFGLGCALMQVLLQYSRYAAVLKWLTLTAHRSHSAPKLSAH
jgi:hypothetical protein